MLLVLHLHRDHAGGAPWRSRGEVAVEVTIEVPAARAEVLEALVARAERTRDVAS